GRSEPCGRAAAAAAAGVRHRQRARPPRRSGGHLLRRRGDRHRARRRRPGASARTARAVTERPLSLAFFDPVRRLHGTARAGMTLLFDGGKPTTLPEGPAVERAGGGWRAQLAGQFELTFEPLADAADLGGA